MTQAVREASTTTRADPPRDIKALEREALAHSAALYKLAARLLGNAAEAEDVLQEAFAKAITELRRGAFRGDCALSSWLYRIVTHAAFDRLRELRKESSQELADERVASATPEAAVALRELGDALRELPDDQRAALVLKEVQGLSAREVAEVLERSEGAVEQLLVRARQALKRRFEP